MIKLGCFKAYDIRGKLNEEINIDIAYKIGRAFAQYLITTANVKSNQIVVGGDVRLTSAELKDALGEGLRDGGFDVIDIGVVGTEEIYFATWYLGVDGGIEVTASHNPMDYNGMKLVLSGSKPISGDSGLLEIKTLAEENNFMPAKRGNLIKKSILTAYVEHILQYINLENFKNPLTLVVNSGNGAAGHVIDAMEHIFIEKCVPIKFIKVHHEPNGNFPNGIPNPLLPEMRKDTIDAVKKNNADLGIAWDGDFDRCFLFDEKGEFVEGYYIVGLLAEAFLRKNKGAKIIHDPRLTWNTIEIVKAAGGIPIQSKTGHAFIKERMRSEDAVYGGEMSAHHYFKDFAYCDSGMIPWLLVIELIANTKIPLSEMVKARIEAYPSSGEINSKLIAPKESIARVLDYFRDDAVCIDKTDGISVEFETWRFNLRSSNTEPVVRLNVESKGDIRLMQEKTKQILKLLRAD